MNFLFLYIIVGFAAQMIDGTMGMAYGVSCNTFLRMTGINSAVSSACVHIAELFTTFASGISHIRLKNVSKNLFFKLLLPGVIGGILGAWLLVSFESRVLDILIDCYLIVMGVIIFTKIFKKKKPTREPGNYVRVLGLAGGFSDAMGGGGWGPVVTSTLLASDHDARKTVGTVNTAEFFVSIAETATFVGMMHDFRAYFWIILGLIIGGVVAAPIGALLCKKIPVKLMLGLIGALIIVLNGIKLVQCF